MPGQFTVDTAALRAEQTTFTGLGHAVGEQATAVPAALLGAAGGAGDGGLIAALEGAASAAENSLHGFETHLQAIADGLGATASQYDAADRAVARRMGPN